MCLLASLWKLVKSMLNFQYQAEIAIKIQVNNHFSFFMFRQYSVEYKLETYLKIARLYLEDDDPVQAEAYINRASLLQVSCFNK